MVDNSTCQFLPTREQELLILAATDPGERALVAWNEWKEGVDLQTIDTGSARVLPLAYTNLRGRAPDDAMLKLAKGTYKKAWYRNQLIFREVAKSTRALADIGVPCLVFNSAAVAARYHQPESRPMEDVDIAVPFHDAARALECLVREGWELKPLPRQQGAPRSQLMRYNAGFELQTGPELFIHLHWNLIATHRTPGADQRFWAGADEVELSGQRVRLPSVTDSLLITCFHGSAHRFSGEVSTLRWCIDALDELRLGRIDWVRFAEHAEFHGIGRCVAPALEYLAENLGAQVPREVRRRLETSPVGVVEKHYAQAFTRYGNWHDMLDQRFAPYTRGVRGAKRLKHARAVMDVLLFKYHQDVGATIAREWSPLTILEHARTFPPWWRHVATHWNKSPKDLSIFVAKALLGRTSLR